jgi:glycosyltransferase involved in cell wall biosynthesis
MDISREKMMISEMSVLIENGNLDVCKEKIQSFLKIYQINAEVYSCISIIEIMEGNFDKAEQTLKQGLELDPTNVDLLFNYGYLLQITNRAHLAFEYYESVKLNTKDEKVLEEVDKALTELEPVIFPKVSVIITAYNQKAKLKRAIDSVLNQSYQNKEIIVADDCSIDGTDELLQGFHEHQEIRYIKNPTNFGLMFNVMQAFYNYTNGKYILILDHDDYLVDNSFIDKAVKMMEKNHMLSMVVANCYIEEDQSGGIHKTNYDMDPVINGRDYFLNYMTGNFNHINSGLTTLFKKENAISMGCLKEISYSKDLFLHLKLMLTGDVGFLEDHVAVYTLHEENVSKNMPIEYDYTTFKELNSLRDYCLQNGFSTEEMEKWLDLRIYLYLRWRFYELWNMNNKSKAFELLTNFRIIYPNAVDRILGEIS